MEVTAGVGVGLGAEVGVAVAITMNCSLLLPPHPASTTDPSASAMANAITRCALLRFPPAAGACACGHLRDGLVVVPFLIICLDLPAAR